MKPISRKEAALWLRRWNLLCGRDWFWEFLSGKFIAELILRLLLFVGNEWRSCLLWIDCNTRERERESACVCVVCDEEARDWVRLRNTSWILQPATAAGNDNHHRAELTNESCGVMMMMMMQAFFGICCQRVGKVVSGLNSCVALPADLVLAFYQCRGGGGAAAAAPVLTRVSGNRQCTAAGKKGGGTRNKREWDQREEEHQQLQQQQQQVEQEEVWSNSTLQASRSFMA